MFLVPSIVGIFYTQVGIKILWYNLDMKRFIFSFINEWSQLFGEWNWVTFTFINIEFENDKMTQGLELLFIVLGFGFRIRYNKPSSDAIFAKYDEMIEKEFPNIK